MKATTKMDQSEYLGVLKHINRPIYSWNHGGEGELEAVEKSKADDVAEFKTFYEANKDLVDELESVRTKNNRYSFEGEVTAKKIQSILNEVDAPFGPISGGHEVFTPSGLELSNILSDGCYEFKHGFDDFVLDGYTFSHIEDYGGEGQGDQWWVVFSVSKEGKTRHFKWDGWYASYDGGHLEDVYEVTPKQVTKTVWENIK